MLFPAQKKKEQKDRSTENKMSTDKVSICPKTCKSYHWLTTGGKTPLLHVLFMNNSGFCTPFQDNLFYNTHVLDHNAADYFF